MLEPHRPPKAISLRSVLLGLLGVVIICGLTPYNDYALNNTFFVGNNLPLGVLMLTFLFALFINGPLTRYKPQLALSSGEMAVAMTMMLVSCCLPSSGLMRFWPGSVVMPFWHARSDARFLSLLESLNLPAWLFPSMDGSRPSQWMFDPVVTGYAQRWTEPGPQPLTAWLQPGISWGIFFFAMFGTLICMTAIVRRQWFENERLPFPLAQIELALIEQPKPGTMLNSVMGRRSFWIGFAIVFCLHFINGLHEYWPKYVPELPIQFDLRKELSEDPWRHMDDSLKWNKIFFSAVGVTYFLSAPVGFSLWAFYVGDQALRMVRWSMTGDPTLYGRQDQHIGGLIAFSLAIIWVGRHHWRLVIAQALRGERDGEPRGRYLSYPFAFWSMCTCMAAMYFWLYFAGASLIGAAVIVGAILLPFFVITRIIAETGWIHGQVYLPIYRPWEILSWYGFVKPVSVETFYLSGTLNSTLYDFREVLPVYATHSLKLTDQTRFAATMASDTDADRRTGRGIIGCIVLALVVGYVVSLTSMLLTEYTYYSAKDYQESTPINVHGSYNNVRWMALESTNTYIQQNYNFQNEPITDMGIGFGITALLSFLRLHFTWWPLHPIGFLMLGRFPAGRLWFSFLCGWLIKTLFLRFGGSRGYANGKVFFIGVILGDCIAAGFWLLMGVALSSFGITWRPVRIMPE